MIERKAMIRNRYNYLIPSVQSPQSKHYKEKAKRTVPFPNIPPSKTPKGKKDALKATAQQSTHYKQKTKRTVSFHDIGQTASQNKKNHQDIHAKDIQ